jgi:hypothetical protein
MDWIYILTPATPIGHSSVGTEVTPTASSPHHLDANMETPPTLRQADNRDDRVVLDPWEELRGTLKHIEEGEAVLEVHLSSGTLVYDRHSAAATRLRDECTGSVGAIVSVLRTVCPAAPIRVSIEDTE